MRKLICSLFFLVASYSAWSQQLHELVEGAEIKVAGTIRLEQSGNNSYLMIKPDSPYEAVFDSTDRRKVCEIGLSLAGQWDALKPLVGKRVSVSGVVQLEPASPYYFNGTLIIAKSIRLADGSVLTPKGSLSQFHVLVTFSPRAWDQFTDQAWDAAGHQLPASQEYLNCRLNGPGDVMNCYCPDGFAFTAKGKMNGSRFFETEAPEAGFDFAQYVIADPVRHFVRVAVECTREAHR
jgi:hypothetical protein